ncbi:hypothetical protein GBAR_LOCUS11257 [Geodia barretti]|uniref:Secreted protein n=1 Tax=Geodia barretti TaxID=519541 RepID=A0AA35RWK4_GEOBA|nr:hypothetical protein GBAR_LOCUS11257 [Geodia barretti]
MPEAIHALCCIFWCLRSTQSTRTDPTVRTTAVFSDLKNSQRWEYSRRNRIGIRLLFQLLIGRDAAIKVQNRQKKE